MRNIRKSGLLAILATFGIVSGVMAAAIFNQVRPGEYDPAKTFMVQAAWLTGIGCPTDATTTAPGSSYTDPACPTGDSRDNQNQGLLLAKTGPTANNAEPFAELKDLSKTPITELGYDLRKPGSTADLRGSTCSVEAPMFQLQTASGDVYYIGCNSPAPTTQTAGEGFLRLRWGAGGQLWANGPSGLENISGWTFTKAYIVFQDGYGPGTADPSNFGLAVLDNIDVNAVLVGRE